MERNTLGGRDLVEFGPSWKKRAVCLIPYENLLIASNKPETGFVNRPVNPKAKPLNIPAVPNFFFYYFGCLTIPVIASSHPVQRAHIADLVPCINCLLFCICIFYRRVINFSSKVIDATPLEQLSEITSNELNVPAIKFLKK